MLDSTTTQPLPQDTRSPKPPTTAQPAPYVNSVDATVGQPLVDRVIARRLELEGALRGLPLEDLRGRNDLELALSTVGELLTGDLAHIPAIVSAGLNQWLERNKHLAERAPVVISDPVVDAVTAPIVALESERETTS